MTRFILAIIRFIALCLSYSLSTLAAALFMTFVVFLGSDPTWLQDDPLVAMGSVAFTATLWFSIAQLALAPALLALLVLEFARMESFLANLLAGGFCALVVMVLLPQADVADALNYPLRETWLVSIAAGFVGGLAHWILAGHRAGRWMGPRPISP